MRTSTILRKRRDQWRRVLRGHCFPSQAVRAGVLFSAGLDVARQTIPRLRSSAPIALVGGTVVGDDGIRFHARPRSDDLYTLLPGRENDVHDAILGPLGADDVFVDVGANVGYYSVYAANRVGRGGQVVAFEAWPPTAAQLRRNLALNDLRTVRLVEAAVGNEAAGSEVCFEVKGGAYGLGRVADVESGNSVVVRTTTLDRECAALTRIRMMKVDVEGGELAVLQGATETLRRTDFVVVEYSDRPPVEALLVDAGFDVRPLQFTTHLLGVRRP